MSTSLLETKNYKGRYDMGESSMFLSVFKKFWHILLVATIFGATALFSYSMIFEKTEYIQKMALSIGINEAGLSSPDMVDVPGELNVLVHRCIFLVTSTKFLDEKDIDRLNDDKSIKLTAQDVDSAGIVEININGRSPERVTTMASLLPGTLSERLKTLDSNVEIKVIIGAGNILQKKPPEYFTRAFLGGICGFSSAFFILLLLYYLRNPVNNAKQLGAITGLPVFAVIPGSHAKLAHAKAMKLLASYLRFATIVDRLTLAFATPSKHHGYINIPKELAGLLASFGLNVLYIDCSNINDVVYTWQKAGEALIPDHQSTLGDFSPARINELIQNTKADYNRILVNLPPVIQYPDSAELARQMDSVIMLIEADRTSEDALGCAQRLLSLTGTVLTGAVLSLK